MNALVGMNNTDQHSESKPLVAMHRLAELNTLLSKEFQDRVKRGAFKLITYRDLLQREGLEKMKGTGKLMSHYKLRTSETYFYLQTRYDY